MPKGPSPFAELIRHVKTLHGRPYAARHFDELVDGALLCSSISLASETDHGDADSLHFVENLHRQCRLDRHRTLKSFQDRLGPLPSLSKNAQ